ncbi:unnamed protein product [Chrysoparadoxa australica]
MSLAASTLSGSMHLTCTMKETMSERNGPRRTIYGVKPNEHYAADMRFYKSSQRQPYKAGDKYQGDWVEGKKEGYGTKTWVSGNKYEGEWVADCRHGKGAFWVNDEGHLRKQYTGDWENDTRSGQGIMYYKDGSRYEGSWENGQRCGEGKMVHVNGDVYQGSWLGGKKCGKGVLRLANGDIYDGHWMDHNKEGPGRYYFMSTRKIYEGEWVNDAPRCGEYKDMPEQLASTDIPDEGFSLPPLGLDRPKAVLGDAIAVIRNERAVRFGQPGRVFTTEEMTELRAAFDRFDTEGQGVVPAGVLPSLLASVGFKDDDSALRNLLEDLQAALDTVVVFSEFMDILALLW